MSEQVERALERLRPLLGEWSMEAIFPADSPAAGMDVEGVAKTSWEWMPGERFLIQRWQVPNPQAPDGVAVIGWDEGRGALLQHYFDSRGVARLYEVEFGDGLLVLTRTEADFSPLDFSQRFEGRLSEDGSELRGEWQTSEDGGADWKHDFQLNYARL